MYKTRKKNHLNEFKNLYLGDNIEPIFKHYKSLWICIFLVVILISAMRTKFKETINNEILFIVIVFIILSSLFLIYIIWHTKVEIFLRERTDKGDVDLLRIEFEPNEVVMFLLSRKFSMEKELNIKKQLSAIGDLHLRFMEKELKFREEALSDIALKLISISVILGVVQLWIKNMNLYINFVVGILGIIVYMYILNKVFNYLLKTIFKYLINKIE